MASADLDFSALRIPGDADIKFGESAALVCLWSERDVVVLTKNVPANQVVWA